MKRFAMSSGRLMVFVGVLLVFFGGDSAARAGLYNSAEMNQWRLGPDFAKDFRPTLITLQSIAQPQIKLPIQRRYELICELAVRVPQNLSIEEKLNLSAYFMRRGRPLEAESLLLPLARDPKGNFLVLCNLATACQMQGKLQRAIDYLSQALSMWPEHFDELDDNQKQFFASIDWNEGPYGWYRKVETYQLKLLKLRAREQVVLGGKPFTAVDALFGNDDGPVKYVGPEGKFEVGKLAYEEKKKLPGKDIDNAIDIIKQLLIWLPHDARLEWQLAELYNARGSKADLRAASTLFDEIGRGLRIDEVLSRRNALGEVDFTEENPLTGNLLTPGQVTSKMKKDDEERTPAVNWRTVGVSFGTGFVVGLFFLMQLREFRRRAAQKQESRQ